MDAELIDYLTTLMPDAKTSCEKCGKTAEVSKAVRVGDKFYCSATCEMQSNALLIKRQPKGMQIDGYDV